MVQKKISTGMNNTAAVIDLDDDEQLIETVTTTKAIGRQKRKPPPDDEPITVEPIEDDDDDDDLAEANPSYSDTSLAALIYGEGDDAIDQQFCTVVIRRNPDSINDRFATPCTAQTNLPPMRNVELTAEKMDIEERVRAEFGGGHYFFQLQFNNRLQTSWKATLSDPPLSKTPPAVADPAPAQPPPAVAAAVDPFDNFLDNLEKQKRMRDLLFGDEQRRLEKQIEDLKIEAAKPQPPAAPQSETLVILEKALASSNPEISDRLLEYAFPTDKGENRHWIAELASVVMDNKETIAGVLGSLLGGGPQPAAAAPPNVAELMKMQPPPSLPKFSRTKPEPIPDPVPAEPELITAEPPPPAPTDADRATAELPIIDVEETPEPAAKARGKAK